MSNRAGSLIWDVNFLWGVLFLFLQKATPPPADNTGANTTSVTTDMLTDPALIIKDRPVSALLPLDIYHSSKANSQCLHSAQRLITDLHLSIYIQYTAIKHLKRNTHEKIDNARCVQQYYSHQLISLAKQKDENCGINSLAVSNSNTIHLLVSLKAH